MSHRTPKSAAGIGSGFFVLVENLWRMPLPKPPLIQKEFFQSKFWLICHEDRCKILTEILKAYPLKFHLSFGYEYIHSRLSPGVPFHEGNETRPCLPHLF